MYMIPALIEINTVKCCQVLLKLTQTISISHPDVSQLHISHPLYSLDIFIPPSVLTGYLSY